MKLPDKLTPVLIVFALTFSRAVAAPGPGDSRDTVEKSLGAAHIVIRRDDGTTFAKYERGKVVYDASGKVGSLDLLDDRAWAAYRAKRDADHAADQRRVAELRRIESDRLIAEKTARAAAIAADEQALNDLLVSPGYQNLSLVSKRELLHGYTRSHPYAYTRLLVADLDAKIASEAAAQSGNSNASITTRNQPAPASPTSNDLQIARLQGEVDALKSTAATRSDEPGPGAHILGDNTTLFVDSNGRKTLVRNGIPLAYDGYSSSQTIIKTDACPPAAPVPARAK